MVITPKQSFTTPTAPSHWQCGAVSTVATMQLLSADNAMRSPRMRTVTLTPWAARRSAACLLRRRQFKCKSYKHWAKRASAVRYWCVGWGTNHTHKLTQNLHNISFFYNWLSIGRAWIYGFGFRQLRDRMSNVASRPARYNYIAPTPPIRPSDSLYWRLYFIAFKSLFRTFYFDQEGRGRSSVGSALSKFCFTASKHFTGRFRFNARVYKSNF